jgi:hypothetical protein
MEKTLQSLIQVLYSVTSVYWQFNTGFYLLCLYISNRSATTILYHICLPRLLYIIYVCHKHDVSNTSMSATTIIYHIILLHLRLYIISVCYNQFTSYMSATTIIYHICMSHAQYHKSTITIYNIFLSHLLCISSVCYNQDIKSFCQNHYKSHESTLDNLMLLLLVKSKMMSN